MQSLSSRTTTAISKPLLQPAWNGLSNASTFLRCLRLLDLDLRDDWPGLVEEHFAARQQNLQQRIRGVEWALYKLFEIWDPQETANVKDDADMSEKC